MVNKSCDLLIVNHNTVDKLERLLRWIPLHLPDNLELNIFIQDNGSTDGSVGRLNRDDMKDLYTDAWSMPNVGYARAINRMASITDGDYLAAINGDVWMTGRDVEQVIERMELDDSIAVSSPKQRNEQYKIVHAGIIGTNTNPRHRGWMQHDTEDKLYRDVVDCVTVSGSAYFMRRSIWDEVVEHQGYQDFNRKEFGDIVRGGFLQTPHYYEETFYSYFVRHLGYRVIYDGHVSIGHTWHASAEVGTGHDRPENVGKARRIFRRACDHLGIERD